MRILLLVFCTCFPLAARKVVADVVLSPGDILTANFFDSSITRVDPITGAQSVVSSGGNLFAALGIAIDAAGNILTTSEPLLSGVVSIVQVDPTTGAQKIISSGNNLRFPVGITIDAGGELLVADRSAHAVIQIDPITGSQKIISSGGNFNAPVGSGPNGIAIDPAGNILVAGERGPTPGSGYIVRVDPTTGAQTVVSEGGILNAPNAIAIDAAGNFLVADGTGNIIRVNPITGLQSVVSSGDNLSIPLGIAIDRRGKIVTNSIPPGTRSGSIIRIDPITGAQTIVSSGGSLQGPAGIAIVPVTPISPPVINDVSASPRLLWPPNNKFVDVTIGYNVVSTSPATCSLSVTSNESGSEEWKVLDEHHVLLRAARAGNGTGRTYIVTIRCANEAGDATEKATVTVPHDRS